MENNKFTPETICQGAKIYNIPIYQRLFAWDEANVMQLLDDLKDLFTKSPDKPYYIGMLTMHGNDLVDGQQRFTVLSLIASVFQRYYAPWSAMKGKLHLSARVDDADYLCSLFGDKPRKDVENQKMRKGREAIEVWVKDNESTLDIISYAEYVFKYCTFFIATLPEGYQPRDLNKYFEAMNSTGRNLESHEIVKVVKYLKSMTSEQDLYNDIWNIVADMDKPLIRKKTKGDLKEKEEDFRGRYMKAIYQFDTLFPDGLRAIINDLSKLDENDQQVTFVSIRDLQPDGHNPDVRRQDRYYGEGYHSILSFPEFLLQILYIQLPQDVREAVNVNEFFDTHKLQATIDEYTCSWKEHEWKQFGQEMLRYRLIYDYYVIRIPNSEAGDYNLDYSDTADSDVDAAVITQIQSLLFVDSSSKTYYRWIMPLLEYLKVNQEATADAIFRKIQEIDNNIDEHSRAFLEDESSYSYGGRRTVYFLRRLDFYLWLRNHRTKNTSEESYSIINNFRFKRGINSQEHLHPQHDVDRDGYKPWGQQKHKFGNLFLISSSFNSTQSDDTINTKFGRIKDQIAYSRIESIKLYYIWCLCNKEEKQWTIENMQKHQKEMMEVLLDSYGDERAGFTIPE